MKVRHAAGLYAAIALALAAFTGTALAGNGHGNAGGNGGGNGQQATTQPAQPAQQSTQASEPASSQHERKHDQKHASTSSSTPTTSDNSTGVKPSSTTQKDTHERASSNKTKQYGNGQTAGQIATKAGYGNATLHGPGNSQPHKTDCGKHEVDVHALKNKGSKCAEEQSASSAVSTHQSKHEHVKAEAHVKSHVHVKVEQSGSKGVSESAHLHVTICHATGSSSHPFVVISPSASGVFHGHLGHQDSRDIVPAFVWRGQTYSQNWDAAGQTMFNAGCKAAGAAAAAQTEEKTDVESTTTTTNSTDVTVTTTATTNASTSSSSVAATPAAAPASGVAGVQVSQSQAPAAAPAAGVAGETVALPQSNAQPTGGVLGATTRLGGTVASSHLPFTGLPLWLFAAVAAALILVGLTVRRSAADRV
jgi:hypothetical protein